MLNRVDSEPSSHEYEAFLGNLWDTVGNKVGGAVGAVTDRFRIEDRTHLTPKSKRIRTRDPKTVYALVLHQMAFSRGSDPGKYDKVGAHYAILPDGKTLQLHPVSAYLYASNGFNKGSVAVEFAGNFPNTKGKCWQSAKFGCHTLTQAQIDAGRYLVRHLIRTVGLTHILAHRQSSGTRENDPGPDIWRQVGQWGVDTLGLKDGGPGFKVGSGNPIPEAWRTWGSRAATPELETSPTINPAPIIDPDSPAHTRWLQRSLNHTLGLRLPVDGRMNPAVRSAVRAFRRSHGAFSDGEIATEIDGEVDDELETLLIAAGAPPHRHPGAVG